MRRRGHGAGFRQVFGYAEFRGLWMGALLSRAGDQLARVALAVIAYQRTGSAALTAVVYALTLVPALLGGPLLGWLADRYPRREVMISCDLVRTVLIALVAIPDVPLPVLCALVFASQLLESPARAARIAMLPDILPADAYPTGVAVNHLTSQLMTLIGFAGGGLIVALTGPGVSLVIDAATFAACALITTLAVRRRPASGRQDEGGSWLASTGGGLRLVTGTATLRSLLVLALMSAFHVIPEGIAVPYAASLGLGTTEAGVLMAVVAVGNVLGVFLLTRYVPLDSRLRLMGPMAIAASVPLAASLLQPGFVVLLVLWTVSGALTSYQVMANAEFVRILPPDRRGQAIGLASSALVAVQGLGILLGGLLAEWAGPANGLAIAGVAGIAAAIPATLAWNRARAEVPIP
ncbi:MFS transporter [Streptosporangium sp. KLBMP 9127]|nr:MFS transporter [Streptosporangium sp. KLBMP 9127]